MYRFKMQKLLDYRKRVEETLQKEMGELQRRLASEREALHGKETVQRDCCRELDRRQTHGITAVECRIYADFIARLRADRRALSERVEASSQAVSQQRRNLLEAMKDRKKLDRLNEVEHGRYARQRKRAEEKRLDEIAARGFGCSQWRHN